LSKLYIKTVVNVHIKREHLSRKKSKVNERDWLKIWRSDI
jgi:hypothetical protein